jgi:2-succinyl-6-hydroxy-2,4-cyclohexadiene-1-carboxylate synthase
MSVLPSDQSWTVSSVVADLAWIIDSLPGGRADVLGYSMGGRLALALATAYPQRVQRLILESASPGIADEQERRTRQLADEQLAERIVLEGLKAFVAQWERLPMWDSQAALPEAERERQRQTRLGHSAAGLAANLRATGTGAQPSYWEHLAELEIPTMLIAGKRDHKFAQIAGRMHEAIPDARLDVVPDAGHAVHLEQPDWYVQLVTEFLEQPVVSTMQTKGRDRD